MKFFVRTPKLLSKLFSKRTWFIPGKQKVLYITFDDGPHPVHTPWVLNELDKANAKATFFVIGKNVEQNRAVYADILLRGHVVGNHTNQHLNGWKTKDDVYLNDIRDASRLIDSTLFRPPYGRLSTFQQNILLQQQHPYKIIMWSVLSGDFDLDTSPETCANNVIVNARAGDIIVFHDSEKAANNMRFGLPKVLDYFSQKGFTFKAINASELP